MAAVSAESMPPLNADDHALEAAFANVIARPHGQRLINRLAFVRKIVVAVAGQLPGVHQHQIFFERSRARDHFTLRIHREAGSVEKQLIVPAHLVHVYDRHAKMARGGGEDLGPLRALAHVIRRRVDADQDARSGRGQFLHRIAAVAPALPILLVVPDVFANGQRGDGIAQRQRRLFRGRLKIARFIEDVVGGQQHFMLAKRDAPALQHRGAVVDRQPGGLTRCASPFRK